MKIKIIFHQNKKLVYLQSEKNSHKTKIIMRIYKQIIYNKILLIRFNKQKQIKSKKE